MSSFLRDDFDFSLLRPAAPPPPPSLMDRAKRGLASTVNAGRMALADRDELAELVASDSREQLPQSDAAQQMAAEIAPYQQRANDAEGIGAVTAWASLAAKRVSQFVSNPREFAGMIAENLPNSLPGMAAGVAGGAAGAATPLPGGAMVGGLVGGTAGGYLVEQGAAMREQILKEAQARGIDPRDASALSPLIAEKYDEFIQQARLKGLGTAATDSVLNRLTLGLAGAGERTIVKEAGKVTAGLKAGTIGAKEAGEQLAALEASQAARNTLGARVARGAGITGMEMFGEGASEAAGQLLAYGKADAGDVVDEALLGLGQGGGMAIGEHAIGKAMGVTTRDQAQDAIISARHEAQSRITQAGSVDEALAAFNQATMPGAPKSGADILEAAGTSLGAAPPPAPDGIPWEPSAHIETGGLAMSDAEEVARSNVAAWAARSKPLELEDAQRLADAGAKRGQKLAVVARPDQGYAVVPRSWVTQSMLEQPGASASPELEQAMVSADRLSLEPVGGKTPAPKSLLQLAMDRTQTGRMIAGADGQVRPELRSEQVARENQANERSRAEQLAAELGLTPDVIRAQQARRGAADAGSDAALSGGAGADGVPVSGASQGSGDVVPNQRAVPAVDAGRSRGGNGAGQGKADSATSLTAATASAAKRAAPALSEDERSAVMDEAEQLLEQATPEQRHAAATAIGLRTNPPSQTRGVKTDGAYMPLSGHIDTDPQAVRDALAQAIHGEAPDVSPTGAPVAAQAPADGEWRAFGAESGTKAIPRAEMPQVKAEHRGALVNFLNARGIEHKAEELDAGELKPTQAEFSPAKVRKAIEYTGGDRSILVSQDGHVLDGHHQWLAASQKGQPVKAIRLQAPIERLLREVAEFPSVGQSDGATSAAAAHQNTPKREALRLIDAVNDAWRKLHSDGHVWMVGDPVTGLRANAPQDIKDRYSRYQAQKEAARQAYFEAFGTSPDSKPVTKPAQQRDAQAEGAAQLESLESAARQAAFERFDKDHGGLGSLRARAARKSKKGKQLLEQYVQEELKKRKGALAKAERRAAAGGKKKGGPAVDVERDTLLVAVAKLGGIRRDELAREFGLKPEELKARVKAGNLSAYPFRVNGGMSIDGAIERLQELGYFDGVPDDEVRRELEAAIFDELGGDGRLSTAGQARRAEQLGAERAEQDAQADMDPESLAELEAERAAIMAEDDDLQLLEVVKGEYLPDLDEALAGDEISLARALGFTEEEIANEFQRQDPRARADEGREGAPGEGAGQAAARETAAPGRAGSEAPRGAAAGEGLSDGAADDATLNTTGANLPAGVREGVRRAAEGLASAVRYQSAQGPVGRRNALSDTLDSIISKLNTLAAFREAAARKGYDAERVIDRFGPEPQLRDLLPQADRQNAQLPNDERLVLLCCGETKLDRAAPARELYTGPTWQTFRTHAPTDLRNVAVVSAKYGLVHGDDELNTYEQPMTLRRQAAVRAALPDQAAQLAERLATPVREVIIVGGFDYRNAQVDAVLRLMKAGKIAPDANVIQVDGQIGEQRQRLGELLRAMPQAATPERQTKVDAHRADPVAYAVERIPEVLDKLGSDGVLSRERLANNLGDPSRPGSLIPADVVAQAIEQLDKRGDLFVLKGNVHLTTFGKMQLERDQRGREAQQLIEADRQQRAARRELATQGEALDPAKHKAGTRVRVVMNYGGNQNGIGEGRTGVLLEDANRNGTRMRLDPTPRERTVKDVILGPASRVEVLEDAKPAPAQLEVSKADERADAAPWREGTWEFTDKDPTPEEVAAAAELVRVGMRLQTSYGYGAEQRVVSVTSAEPGEWDGPDAQARTQVATKLDDKPRQSPSYHDVFARDGKLWEANANADDEGGKYSRVYVLDGRMDQADRDQAGPADEVDELLGKLTDEQARQVAKDLGIKRYSIPKASITNLANREEARVLEALRAAAGKAEKKTLSQLAGDEAQALRKRAAEFDPEGNRPRSRTRVDSALDDFNNRILSAEEFKAILDQVDKEGTTPAAFGDWDSRSGGVMAWTWEGMTFGQVTDLQKAEGAGPSKKWRTSDGERFDSLRDAKAHEIETTVAERLARDGFTGGAGVLNAQTTEELRQREDARRRADQADKREQQRLADKAKADAELGEFTLTGSDAPADIAAAAGQADLFAGNADPDAASMFAGDKVDPMDRIPADESAERKAALSKLIDCLR